MVLPLDSHFSMDNVSYTKSGLVSTNISRGDILEYNLLGVYDKSPNRYHTVENDTIINYLTKIYWAASVQWHSWKITKFTKSFHNRVFP